VEVIKVRQDYQELKERQVYKVKLDCLDLERLVCKDFKEIPEYRARLVKEVIKVRQDYQELKERQGHKVFQEQLV
jgi:hypothetical protein